MGMNWRRSLLDVDAMNSNPAVVSKPHTLVERPPYVVSEMGLTVHRTLGVRQSRDGSELAVFECGQATFYPRYYTRRPVVPKGKWTRYCAKCGL